MADLTSIRNIGPAFATALTDVGITTAEDLRSVGADAAYAKLLRSGHRPHFIGYYVLHMALQGRPWNDCKGEEKAALRLAFDKLKNTNTLKPDPASDFEAVLDRIGIVASR